jgi:predicted GTPase
MIFQRDYSLVSSEPHTTRDVIRLEKDQRLFSDTAGVTKRQRQSDTIRYISYRLTNREFKEASAVIVIVDISDLNFLYVDRELIGRAIELQIPTLIIFNKIDLVDDEMLQQYKLAVKKRHLIPRYLPVFYLSLKEDNSKTILSTLDLLLEQGRSRYSVKYLNDTIRTRINARLLGNKMRFIKQTANKTPSFLIFMARLLDANRFKFVENALREELKLNIPIAVRQVRSR